jgi:hypothetical protein
LAKKQDRVAVGQYYQNPIDIELQKLKSSQALKEKFKKIKRKGRFLSFEKKVSVPYLHDLPKFEREKGAIKYKYLYGEGFNASTGPDIESYQLFGTEGDYPKQPTGIGSSEEIANGSEVNYTKILNEEGYFNGSLDSHRKSKSQKVNQSKHRLGPIVKDDSVGPGSYDLNFNKSAIKGHKQSLIPGGFTIVHQRKMVRITRALAQGPMSLIKPSDNCINSSLVLLSWTRRQKTS